MGRIRKSQETVRLGSKRDDQKVWRVAAYIRLSKEDMKSADEERDQSESIINQKKIIVEHLERQFDGQYVIVDFYIDDGLTGTDDTREDFLRMLTDIERNQVDCVICKTLARIFRNYSDQGYYLEEVFLKKNIRFISIGDPCLDTLKNPDALTGLEVPITGIMNDRFAAKTSNDVRRTFATKRRKGEFIGAFAPYGYLKDPRDKNHLILDEEIAKLKRDIRNWIVHDGMSLNGAVQKLNELGIPNPTAYKHQLGLNYQSPRSQENDGMWSPSTLKRILLAKVNLGHMEQGKQRVVSYKVHDVISVPEEEWFFVENTHEPTFTQAEYDELASVLARDTRTPNGQRNVHLFSGFLKCGSCKKAMQRRPSKNYVYYTCRTYKEKSRSSCTKHTIRTDILEEAVVAALQLQIAVVEEMAARVERVNQRPTVQTQSGRIDALLKTRHQELAKIKRAAESLYLDWKAQEVSTDAYRRMRDSFETQLAQINMVIANLESEQRSVSEGITTENPLFAEFLKFRNIEKLDRGVLISLVDTIFIHEDKQITIRFKYSDQYRRVAEFLETNEEFSEVI